MQAFSQARVAKEMVQVFTYVRNGAGGPEWGSLRLFPRRLVGLVNLVSLLTGIGYREGYFDVIVESETSSSFGGPEAT